MASTFTIWTNANLPASAMQRLSQSLGNHRLIQAAGQVNNLTAGKPDPQLEQADIAFGQPDPSQLIALPRLKWSHLNSAGYTRYDTDAVRAALKSRGALLTNSSGVYAEPCAQHALAMMLSFSRQLPQSQIEQFGTRAWSSAPLRLDSFLLTGQTVLFLGFGAIARRLAQMLSPFGMKLIAIRRSPTPEPGVEVRPLNEVDTLLKQADHVVNILPGHATTDNFMSAARLALLKPSAHFYNIGRGTTVDQPALVSALKSKKIAGAYLDVTEPEPLPKDHPLWSLPNCFITPHTAGGHATEFERLVDHFLENLNRFERGEALNDRVF